ncbi:DNA polymerase IV [soil metagenome]
MAATGRTILHVDMDAFFAAVEVLRDPSLLGKPVIVGGAGDRGVVAAASYEARVFGIFSAMPSSRARRLCPHAVFVRGDHRRYQEVSARVMELFATFTPLVEPLSLDEAFLDVTGAGRLHGDGERIGHQIRALVLEREQLTCSVGVAPNKFLAKLASEAAKPRPAPGGRQPGLGVKVVAPGGELAFLHPLPVRALWGVGPATLAKLERLGVATVGDLASLPEAAVVGSLGAGAGRHLHRLAHALYDRTVEPVRRPKSVGHEETFAHDHHRHDTLRREIVRLADSTASRLRRQRLAGRTITLKVRFGDFSTITRSVTLPTAVDAGPTIARAAKGLLDGVDPSAGVRLVGVTVSGLSDAGTRQLSLDDVDAGSWDDASDAVERIRGRFGDDAIVPAALTGADGIRIKRRGDQQWGPDAPS